MFRESVNVPFKNVCLKVVFIGNRSVILRNFAVLTNLLSDMIQWWDFLRHTQSFGTPFAI